MSHHHMKQRKSNSQIKRLKTKRIDIADQVFNLKSDEDDVDDVIRRIEKEFHMNRSKSL